MCLIQQLNNVPSSVLREKKEQQKDITDVLDSTIKQRPLVAVPSSPGDMPEGTLRAILKQAGISPDEFLDKK